jgi:uncharacterized membrane protein YcaP (DUF421 family)
MDGFRQLIGPDEGASAAQLCVRAVLLFAVGIFYIRLAGRRTFAQYSPLDIVVALIVGSNLSRLMTGKAAFFPGLAATFVVVVVHRLLAMATLRWGWLSWLVKSRPIRIIENGRADARAMKRANLSEEDLREAIRMEQVAEPSDVKLATLEPSGKLSVVPERD